MKKLALSLSALALAAGLLTGRRALGQSAPPAAAAKADVELTLVAVEYEGTKMWLPGTIIAKRGDKVRLNLINNMKSEPNQHGFSIDELGVSAVVTRGKMETVEFIASKPGIFRAYCQLHPKHVGGQLVVLP